MHTVILTMTFHGMSIFCQVTITALTGIMAAVSEMRQSILSLILFEMYSKAATEQ